MQRKQKQELVKLIYRKAQNGVELKTIFEEDRKSTRLNSSHRL